MRYIWIIRHGKSAYGTSGQRDHDRPLNPRGQRDGPKMQSWFALQAHPAEWVWSSSAVRAKLTAGYVSAGFNARLVEEPELYLATPETILNCLQSTPAEIRSTAVVAHNPGLTYLVNRLGAEPVTDNLVTFGAALFEVDEATVEWIDLSFGGARLLSVHSPKTIP